MGQSKDRWSPGAPLDWREKWGWVPMLSRRWLLDAFTLGTCLLMSLASPLVCRAQADPAVRDRVVPAAVEIAILVDVTSDEVTTPQALPVGSGSIVSSDGLI